LLTEVGPVDVAVPRDREGTFAPAIVPKRSRRLGGVEDLVISLSAKGLTHGEICAHLAEVYGAEVSKDRITAITDRVMDGMAEWQNRPLDAVYPVVFIDCIHVKIRDGQVANRPIYVALAVTVDGGRDVLGLWAGDGGEGAKWWLRVLTEIRNRGVGDVCMVVCDGLKGLPDAIGEVWPQAVVQTCIIHLIRNSLAFVSWKDRKIIMPDLKAIYRAETAAAALAQLDAFEAKWGKRYPAIGQAWRRAWEHVVPLFAFPPAIRKMIYTTNAVESLNRSLRKIIKTRGSFPTDEAALKLLFLAIRNAGLRWCRPIEWTAAMGQFAILFGDRFEPSAR